MLFLPCKLPVNDLKQEPPPYSGWESPFETTPFRENGFWLQIIINIVCRSLLVKQWTNMVLTSMPKEYWAVWAGAHVTCPWKSRGCLQLGTWDWRSRFQHSWNMEVPSLREARCRQILSSFNRLCLSAHLLCIQLYSHVHKDTRHRVAPWNLCRSVFGVQYWGGQSPNQPLSLLSICVFAPPRVLVRPPINSRCH